MRKGAQLGVGDLSLRDVALASLRKACLELRMNIL